MTRKEIWKPGEAEPPLAGSTLPASPAPPVATQSPARSVSASRDRLVFISMGIVTAALAAMLYAQFAFSAAAAILLGGFAWSTFMLIHQQVHKNAQIASLKAELSRLEGHGPTAPTLPDGNLRHQGTAPDGPNTARAGARPSRPRAGVPQPNPGQDAPEPVPSMARAPDPSARWNMSPKSPVHPAPPDAARIAAATGQSPIAAGAAHQRAAKKDPGPSPTIPSPAPAPIPEAALWPGTSLSTSDPMRDQWAFRPRSQSEIGAGEIQSPAVGAPYAPNGATLMEPPAPVSTIETDLAMVQRKIKALADEVNATDAGRLPKYPLPDMGAHKNLSGELELSIDALKSAAGSMRDRRVDAPPLMAQPAPPISLTPDPSAGFGELVIPTTAERIASSQPGSAQPPSAPRRADARDLEFELPPLPELALPPVRSPNVAAIASAIEAGRMDAFLSPIVGLSTHEVSHYEMTIRLKATGGEHIDHDETALLLAGSDLLSLFDIARLNRAAILAARLEARGKSGALLSDVTGPSMTNAAFLETFAHVYEDRETISRQLVLTLSQAATEQFSPSAWQALADMHAFGFRFALDKLDHLSTDFEDLARRGFAFVKLNASALLSGLPARDRFITSDEICRRIAGAGLSLIAGGIDDDATRARIFGFGALLGQGQLFGGARHVSVDPSAARSQSAAA